MASFLKRAVLLFLGLPFLGFSQSLQQVPRLSDSAYISLLTCDPGGELYSQFGHSALGVFDPMQNIEQVYNYGTFSFHTPNFYVKFASGKLLYQLSAGYYSRFMYEYHFQNRKVTECRLNLNQQQKQVLFNLIYENNLPDNRYYQYDFFFDNCATRIIDMLYLALADSLQYYPKQNTDPISYRQYLHQYLNNSYWNKIGIDLILGSVIDVEATPRQSAFLPDYLMDYLYQSKINGNPAVIKTTYPNLGTFKVPKTPWPLRPATLFWLGLSLVVFLMIKLPKKPWVIADRIIFGFLGFLGLIVALLWFATDHDATVNNFNIIWCNPLYLIFIFFIGYKPGKWQAYWAMAILVINLIFLGGWFFWPQSFNYDFLPLILLIILRSWSIMKRVTR